MPGFEIFGDEERKEVQDVLDTGVLFLYGFDQAVSIDGICRASGKLCQSIGGIALSVCVLTPKVFQRIRHALLFIQAQGLEVLEVHWPVVAVLKSMAIDDRLIVVRL